MRPRYGATPDTGRSENATAPRPKRAPPCSHHPQRPQGRAHAPEPDRKHRPRDRGCGGRRGAWARRGGAVDRHVAAGRGDRDLGPPNGAGAAEQNRSGGQFGPGGVPTKNQATTQPSVTPNGIGAAQKKPPGGDFGPGGAPTTGQAATDPSRHAPGGDTAGLESHTGQ
jgi:hypothetical protein